MYVSKTEFCIFNTELKTNIPQINPVQ